VLVGGAVLCEDVLCGCGLCDVMHMLVVSIVSLVIMLTAHTF